MSGTIFNFGTFDVDNYGDLLFPFITKSMLECDIQLISPTNKKPLSFVTSDTPGELLDVKNYNQKIRGVVIGGGNIIHCSPSYLDHYVSYSKNSFGYSDLWIAPTRIFSNEIPIVWNAPGVPENFDDKYHNLIKEVLQRTNYLSVRDEASRNILVDVWKDAKISIVPDSAWAIPDLLPIDYRLAVYEQLANDYGFDSGVKTIVFHINRRYLGGRSLNEVASILDSIADFLNARPILIAMAPCHHDDILLNQVGVLMKSSPILIDLPNTVNQIASCISFASAYFGSSMHGYITAAAFGVPGVCVANPNKPKFEGIISITGDTNAVLDDWQTAFDVFQEQNLEEKRINLLQLQKSNAEALDLHWETIKKNLSMDDFERSTRNTKLNWDRLSTTQNKLADLSLETNLENYKLNFKRQIDNNGGKKKFKDKTPNAVDVQNTNELEQKLTELSNRYKIRINDRLKLVENSLKKIHKLQLSKLRESHINFINEQQRNNEAALEAQRNDLFKSHKKTLSEQIEKLKQTHNESEAQQELAYHQEIVFQLEERDKEHATKFEKIEREYSELFLKLKSVEKENRRISRRALIDVKALQSEIKTIHRSKSWKITAPLRLFSKRYPSTSRFLLSIINAFGKAFLGGKTM